SCTVMRSWQRPCLHHWPALHVSLVEQSLPQPSRKRHSVVLVSHCSRTLHWPEELQLSQKCCEVQILPIGQSSRVRPSGGRPESTLASMCGQAQSASAAATTIFCQSAVMAPG